MKRNLFPLFIAVIIIFSFSVVIYKAVFISMTHDESSSFYYISHKNIWGYLFNSEVWPNANNHWLNTILFQLSSKLFGAHEWSIRLPNILAFALYTYSTFKLSKEISNHALQLSAIAFLMTNPYLLDFFSTARGYGLSLAFIMFAMWQSVLYLKKEDLKHLWIALISLTLGTLSLFSSLIFIPAMMGGLVFILIMRNRNKLTLKIFISPILVISFFTLLNLILTYIPLKTLSGNAEFKWGSSSILDGFQSLVFHAAYGQPYRFNEHFTVGVFTVILLFFSYRVLKDTLFISASKKSTMVQLAVSTFILLIVGMFIARHTIGTYYPVERKTIVFIPFIGLMLVGGIDVVKSNYKNIIAFIISCVFIVHLVLSLDLTQVREWWYDRDTKDFYELIVKDKGSADVIIGCDWMFHPTLSFYGKINPDDGVSVMHYKKQIDTLKQYDYYMVFDRQVPELKSRYHVIHKVNEGRVLMKSNLTNE